MNDVFSVLSANIWLQEYDLNKDGYISPKEFRLAMQHQKTYARFVPPLNSSGSYINLL